MLAGKLRVIVLEAVAVFDILVEKTPLRGCLAERLVDGGRNIDIAVKLARFAKPYEQRLGFGLVLIITDGGGRHGDLPRVFYVLQLLSKNSERGSAVPRAYRTSGMPWGFGRLEAGLLLGRGLGLDRRIDRGTGIAERRTGGCCRLRLFLLLFDQAPC